MIKIFVNLLLSASLVNIFPIDGAVLELQAGREVAPDDLVSSLVYGPVAKLPVASNKTAQPPKKLDLQSFGVVTTAHSVVVMDAASGVPLFAKNPNEVRPIGSISKLMTALVFLDTKPNLSEYVTVRPEDFAGTGRVHLYYNDSVRLQDVLGAALVGSDNTATLALVRYSGLTYSDFVARMNAKASELGMLMSEFEDPSGLSVKNVSTAGELTVLLSEAEQHQDIEQFMTAASLTVRHTSGREVVIPSTNLLLTSALNSGAYKVTAGKTGYIPQAGYCLATAVQHAGDTIYVVVLGASDLEARFEDAMGLAVWTFNTFEWPAL